MEEEEDLLLLCCFCLHSPCLLWNFSQSHNSSRKKVLLRRCDENKLHNLLNQRSEKKVPWFFSLSNKSKNKFLWSHGVCNSLKLVWTQKGVIKPRPSFCSILFISDYVWRVMGWDRWQHQSESDSSTLSSETLSLYGHNERKTHRERQRERERKAHCAWGTIRRAAPIEKDWSRLLSKVYISAPEGAHTASFVPIR